MSNHSAAQACRDAVLAFARRLPPDGPAPHRLVVKLGGHDGMAGLCAVEAALAEVWPSHIAKELVWLTRTASAAEALWIAAYGADGVLLGEASFALQPEAQAA